MLALSDVLGNSQQIERLALLVQDGNLARQQNARAVVAGQNFFLHFHELSAFERFTVPRHELVGLFLGEKIVVTLSDNFLVGHAAKPLVVLVPHHKAQVPGLLHEDGNGQILQDGIQISLLPLSFGDVGSHPKHVAGLPVRRVERALDGLEPDGFSLEIGQFLPGNDFFPQGVHDLQVIFLEGFNLLGVGIDVRFQLPHQLFRGLPPKLGRGAVDQHKMSRAVLHENEVGNGVDDIADKLLLFPQRLLRPFAFGNFPGQFPGPLSQLFSQPG